MDAQSFFDKLLPYARYVKRETGIPVSVSLAQWAHESGFEASNWVGHLNYSGITNGAGGFLQFDTLESFAQAHVATLGLGYYTGVKAAAQTGDTAAVLEALGESPWDAGHYRDPETGKAGGMLQRLWGAYGLAKYDTPLTDGPIDLPTVSLPPVKEQRSWIDSAGQILGNVSDGDWWKRIGLYALIIMLGLGLLLLGAWSLTNAQTLQLITPKEGEA